MKVLLINGSPKVNGNTAAALNEMIQIFTEEGIETELIHVGNQAVRGCVAWEAAERTENVFLMTL